MSKPLLLVILMSWGVAFLEYYLAVPANRIGYASEWSAAQLTIVQEVIARAVFGELMVAWHGLASRCTGTILRPLPA